jgi:hypothetical protein
MILIEEIENMIDPGKIVKEWEKSVSDGKETDFWKHRANQVIEFLREADKAQISGAWVL